MIGNPLQFESERPQVKRARRTWRAREGFDYLAIGGRMPDRGVAGNGFDEMQRSTVRPA
jgi:hypothetical protein